MRVLRQDMSDMSENEREWVKTSDLNDFSDIVDSKHISDITDIV